MRGLHVYQDYTFNKGRFNDANVTESSLLFKKFTKSTDQVDFTPY